MSLWTSDELDTIGRAEELELTTLKSAHRASRSPSGWSATRSDLFIRSWRGDVAAWFRNAQARPEAHIQASGIERDVELVPADQSFNGQIGAAYRAKYTPVAPSYVGPMMTPQARATTLKLERRS
jgi:hypothetical protein